MFSFLTQLFCLLFSSPYICCYFMFLSQTFDGFASQIWGGPRICFFLGGALINRRYFRPSTNISLYLKTVQHRDIWNINMNSYALYRMALFAVTLMTPNHHKPPHFRYFINAFYIVVVGRYIDFKYSKIG